MNTREVVTRAAAALNPLLSRDVTEFDDAVRQFSFTRPAPTIVAVVGMTPGEGRTTVAALVALAAAGWSDQRVAVVDAGVAQGGNQWESVTRLLGGDPAQGRLTWLLEGPPVVGRRRLKEAGTPGGVVPVLSSPFPTAPQQIHAVLHRLRHRADVVVIDTPASTQSPLVPSVLSVADHVVAVARGDGEVDLRLQTMLRWLATTPGRPRPVTAALVARGWGAPTWSDTGSVPVFVVPKDEGLRRRRLDRIGRGAMTAGLHLATRIAAAATVYAGPGVDGGSLGD